MCSIQRCSCAKCSSLCRMNSSSAASMLSSGASATRFSNSMNSRWVSSMIPSSSTRVSLHSMTGMQPPATMRVAEVYRIAGPCCCAGLAHESRRHGILAQHVAQDRPMHRLVAEDARRSMREVAVAECRHCTEIRAYCALFQLGGKSQNIGLVLEFFRMKIVLLSGFDGMAAQLRNGRGKQIRMRLMVALELERHDFHRRLQQAAVRAELVCRYCLPFGAERAVEDRDIVAAVGFLLICSQCFTACKQGNGGRGQQQAGFSEKRAARGVRTIIADKI